MLNQIPNTEPEAEAVLRHIHRAFKHPGESRLDRLVVYNDMQIKCSLRSSEDQHEERKDLCIVRAAVSTVHRAAALSCH